MTHTELIMKLIGPISPTGDASRDPERMQNLKAMCELVENLVTEIDGVHYRNQGAMENSVKEIADYADNFLENTLGIRK